MIISAGVDVAHARLEGIEGDQTSVRDQDEVNDELYHCPKSGQREARDLRMHGAPNAYEER